MNNLFLRRFYRFTVQLRNYSSETVLPENLHHFSEESVKPKNESLKLGESKIDKVPSEKPTNKSRNRNRGDYVLNKNGFKKKVKWHSMPKVNGEILFGLHPVYLALLENRRTFYNIYIKKDKGKRQNLKEKILKLACNKEIFVQALDGNIIDALSEGHIHQGITIDASPLKPLKFTEEIELETKPSISLLLDKIYDPMNFGAILRSAFFFDVKHVFLSQIGTCKMSPIVSKASSGAMEAMSIIEVDQLKLINKLKTLGWTILGTSTRIRHPSATPLENYAITKPTLLVLGNEGHGISEKVSNCCDDFVYIKSLCPEEGPIESLNVGVANGILLHHLSSTIVK